MIPLTFVMSFLLKTVYKLKVSADKIAKITEDILLPEEKSVQTKTPAMQRNIAALFINVILSLSIIAERRIVKTEFEEKIIAISAGESAFKTAYCNKTMLIQMHKT